MSPDGYSLDAFYLARPGAHEVQLDLLLDYAGNVALYPSFQNYLRTPEAAAAIIAAACDLKAGRI